MRTLAQLPDVFSWEHSALSDEETWELVRKVLDDACSSMEDMKAREGKALAQDLEHRTPRITRVNRSAQAFLHARARLRLRGNAAPRMSRGS